jgi:hypothetical protein
MFYSPLEFATGRFDRLAARRGVFRRRQRAGLSPAPPHWIEILGKPIRRVHIKDFKSVGTLAGFCDLLAGDVP